MNTNIKSSSCFDYQAFLNSEVSLIIRGAIKAKCASFLVINFACLLVSLEIRKNPSLGIISYEKFPDWVSIYTKNSLVWWWKIFLGAQPHHREFKCNPPPPRQNYKSQLDINLKSFLKLRKIFPRFPSFRICPNAKYKNSETSEIRLTLLFCSKTV